MPIRKEKIQNIDKTKYWREYEAKETHFLAVGMQNDKIILDNSVRFL